MNRGSFTPPGSLCAALWPGCQREDCDWPKQPCAAGSTALEARADALVEYGNTLPDGVTTEAFAEAELLRQAEREREADRIDEQMYRAGGAPDERELLGEAFDAENGLGASDELLRLAAENTGLPACPFCGGELCAVVLAEDVGGGPGVSCGGCGAYTSRLPWREPWLYEGRTS